MSKVKDFFSKLSNILTGRQPEPDETEELKNDIDNVISELSRCRRRFELVTDSDLIDAAIYEELSLRSRYAYLVKKARAQAETVFQRENKE